MIEAFVIPPLGKELIPEASLQILYSLILLFLFSNAIIKTGKIWKILPFVFVCFTFLSEAGLILHLFFLTPYWITFEILYLGAFLWIFFILLSENRRRRK